jgi:site-specific DNA-methyltransferase (adenine-specific)
MSETPFYSQDGITIWHGDCVDAMRLMPDWTFDIAIVDPPYNVGASDGMFGAGPGRGYRPDLKHYANHDSVPDKEYFDHLFRVSKNQIIWGANYYPQYLHHSGAVIWLKKSHGPLSDAEIAFQSFSKVVSVYKHNWSGFNKEPSDANMVRIHPNQKPVALYGWLLRQYGKKGDTILDTHLGSGSIAIACDILGFNLTAYEIDFNYLQPCVDRIKEHRKQGVLC